MPVVATLGAFETSTFVPPGELDAEVAGACGRVSGCFPCQLVELLPCAFLLGDGYEDHDLVFCRPDGRPFHPEYFSKVFERTLQRQPFS